MQVECIAHWEELYIRSYPLAETSAYARKLVDLPVTVRLEDKSFFLSYRRDLRGHWKVFCSDTQLREIRIHLAKNQSKNLECQVAEVFAQVDAFCQNTLNDKPMDLTRRDALVSLIKEGKGTLLLHTRPDSDGVWVAYYHLGGAALVALSCKAEGAECQAFDVLDVVEPTLLDWELLCQTLKADPNLPRGEMDATVQRFFEALSQSSVVHLKSAAPVLVPFQSSLQALEC